MSWFNKFFKKDIELPKEEIKNLDTLCTFPPPGVDISKHMEDLHKLNEEANIKKERIAKSEFINIPVFVKTWDSSDEAICKNISCGIKLYTTNKVWFRSYKDVPEILCVWQQQQVYRYGEYVEVDINSDTLYKKVYDTVQKYGYDVIKSLNHIQIDMTHINDTKKVLKIDTDSEHILTGVVR